MAKYNYGRREISRVKKYAMYECELSSDDAIVMIGILAELEMGYTKHLTKLANERNKDYKIKWQRGKIARDKLRLEETLKGLIK